MHENDLHHLRTALDLAAAARAHGNHPFGALLVGENNEVLLKAENTVVTAKDCTGHAETNLMRMASAQFSPEELQGCTLYTSTEPCAMCAAAIHWGNVRRVVFALAADDLYALIGEPEDALNLPCREVFNRSARIVDVLGPAEELSAAARQVHEGFWA